MSTELRIGRYRLLCDGALGEDDDSDTRTWRAPDRYGYVAARMNVGRKAVHVAGGQRQPRCNSRPCRRQPGEVMTSSAWPVGHIAGRVHSCSHNGSDG